MKKFTQYDYEKLVKLKEKEGTWKDTFKRLKIPERTGYRWIKKAEQGKEFQVRDEKRVTRIRNTYQYEYRTKPRKKFKKKYLILDAYYANYNTVKYKLSNALYKKDLLKYHRQAGENEETVFEWFVQVSFDIFEVESVKGEEVYVLLEKSATRRISLLDEDNLGGFSLDYLEDNFDTIINQALEGLGQYTYMSSTIVENISINFIWAKNPIVLKKGWNE
ncbi:MAG: hypothetical protein ACOCP4_02565 [Candidatus Woesearchaeota archaeon]